MQNKFLNVEGFTKKFGEFTAVDNVSFSIDQGESFALLGESGCGKTTLLRCIAGLENGGHGKIGLEDKLLFDNKSLIPVNKRNIGLVFQDYAVFPHKTIKENILFGVKNKAAYGTVLDEMLKLFQLEDQVHKMPDQLSGGQLQRVAIARTLAASPSLILLDEPFSNLDRQLGIVLRHELKAIFKDQNLASILVTHDQQEAFAYADRVAIMKEGKILQCDSPENVYLSPASLEVAMFLGNCQFLYGEAHGDYAETAIGKVKIQQAHTGRVKLLIRPECLEPVVSDKGDFSILRDVFHGGFKELKVSDGNLNLLCHLPSYKSLAADARFSLNVQGAVKAFPA